MSLDSFTQQQERMRKQFSTTLGGAPGLHFFDDQIRQNMQLFDRAMKMFSPVGMPFPFPGQPGAASSDDTSAAEPAAPPAPAADESLNDLKKRIEDMQAQIAKLASKA
jgi:polyhydroxyalkanoate synthesis regulator protein